MPRKRGRGGPRPKARSAAQRLGNSALTYVMNTWESLTDEEFRTWRVQGKSLRTTGINYFKHINLRRAHRGEELARVPPPLKPYDARPILKRLEIRNRGGWITLNLELHQTPTVPTTVWGARPCNRGVEKPVRCPRLGWLPASEDGTIEITELYFQKHGEYIKKHRVRLSGKRIFIRIRREVDGGVDLYEEVSALVP
jgi:hypothetical protein